MTLNQIKIRAVNNKHYTKTDIEKIIKVLDKYGICIIPSYLDKPQITAMTDEASAIFLSKNKRGIYLHNHPINEQGKVARCKTKYLSNQSTIKATFNSPLMRDISKEYFQTTFELNDDIYLTHEKESEKDILPWHFDRQQSLKFYLNLLDVNEENGAFNYDLGSHREGHFRANYYILSGMEVGKIPNDIPEEELHSPTVIKAKAGDLIIFDPDGFHKAGRISQGKERKVIRGHSHPLPNRTYKAKPFNAHWWLQTSFNLAKLLNKRASRNLPTSRTSNSKLSR